MNLEDIHEFLRRVSLSINLEHPEFIDLQLSVTGSARLDQCVAACCFDQSLKLHSVSAGSPAEAVEKLKLKIEKAA